MGHELQIQAPETESGALPEAASFAARAESERRAGRLAEAERGLRAGLESQPDSLEGRLVLALVLLDRGLERAARSELERVAEQMLADFGVGELSGPVSEAEIEAAMQRAEREVAADSGPHGVAISAARKFSPTLEAGEGEAAVSANMLRGAFETGTMAELLERQGDERGAARIRQRLAVTSSSGAAAAAIPPGAAQSRARLEVWLQNLRKRKDV